jgi:carboxylate-amine ligase
VEHAFGHGESFLVGVEEELLIVDRQTHRLAPAAAVLLESLSAPVGSAGYEAPAAEIELRSAPCAQAADAAEQLAQLRGRAPTADLTLMGAGVHPTARWGDVALVDIERYAQVGETMRGLIRRTPECALHVHVSMPDPESAIRAYNGLREHLPVLIALGANSPWWFGADSGLASARYALVRSYPRRGVPNRLRDFEHYVETIDAVTAAGELPDYTWVWWDVRLQPKLGTVEVRELDAQSRVSDVAGIGALVQGLACHEAGSGAGARASRGAGARASSGARGTLPTEAIAESCFRACRDGLDASIFAGGAVRPAREVARATIELARPYARDLGSEPALDGLRDVLERGGGAERQRAAYRRGGVEAMLEGLAQETMAPLGRDRGAN